MASNPKIIDLRNLLAQRFPHPQLSRTARLLTGLPFLDTTVSGGLPVGGITELTAPEISSGSASLISALLQTAHRDRYFVALIDGCDSFDPASVRNLYLRHLLWVRCVNASELVKAADLLLRDGNFRIVIADLVLNPLQELRKIPQTAWYRLQHLIEPTATVLLVITRRSIVSSAQLKILLENAWTLRDLDRENPLSSLRTRVQRSHVHETDIALVQAS